MKKPNFERDLHKLMDKMEAHNYAQAVYAALCNNEWKHIETGKTYSCTWRYAGSIVSGIRCEGEDYLNFYCSGMMEDGVPEGVVREDVLNDIKELGWVLGEDKE